MFVSKGPSTEIIGLVSENTVEFSWRIYCYYIYGHFLREGLFFFIRRFKLQPNN